MRPRRFFPVSILFVAGFSLAGGGCTQNSTSSPPENPGGSQEPSQVSPMTSAPPATPPAPPQELRAAAEAKLAEECRALLERIRGFDEAIPRMFLDLQRNPADINKDMVDCAAACESYLTSCGGAPEASYWYRVAVPW